MCTVHVSTHHTRTAFFLSISPCLVCTYSWYKTLEHFKSIQYVKHIIVCNMKHENLFYTKSYDIMCVFLSTKDIDKRFSACVHQHVVVIFNMFPSVAFFQRSLMDFINMQVCCAEYVVLCNFVKLHVEVLFVICAELNRWWQSQVHYLILSQQCRILQAFSNWSFGSFKKFARATRLHCMAMYSCTLYCLQKILTLIITLSLNINFAECNMTNRL